MKKINNKGFTLVELLGVFAILSVIMLVAIPNVMGILDKNKKNTYIQNAKQMIALAEYKLRSDSNITKPSTNKTVIITLGYLDNSELETGPEGWPYDTEQSFVAINVDSNGVYNYYVSLREVKPSTSSNRGIPMISREQLNEETSINYVGKNLNLRYSNTEIHYKFNSDVIVYGTFPYQ